jgi:hypothetical protein
LLRPFSGDSQRITILSFLTMDSYPARSWKFK